MCENQHSVPEIRMCDLLHPYLDIHEEIHAAMAEVMTATSFINGPQVKAFAEHWLLT